MSALYAQGKFRIRPIFLILREKSLGTTQLILPNRCSIHESKVLPFYPAKGPRKGKRKTPLNLFRINYLGHVLMRVNTLTLLRLMLVC